MLVGNVVGHVCMSICLGYNLELHFWYEGKSWPYLGQVQSHAPNMIIGLIQLVMRV